MTGSREAALAILEKLNSNPELCGLLHTTLSALPYDKSEATNRPLCLQNSADHSGGHHSPSLHSSAASNPTNCKSDAELAAAEAEIRALRQRISSQRLVEETHQQEIHRIKTIYEERIKVLQRSHELELEALRLELSAAQRHKGRSAGAVPHSAGTAMSPDNKDVNMEVRGDDDDWASGGKSLSYSVGTSPLKIGASDAAPASKRPRLDANNHRPPPPSATLEDVQRAEVAKDLGQLPYPLPLSTSLRNLSSQSSQWKSHDRRTPANAKDSEIQGPAPPIALGYSVSPPPTPCPSSPYAPASSYASGYSQTQQRDAFHNPSEGAKSDTRRGKRRLTPQSPASTYADLVLAARYGGRRHDGESSLSPTPSSTTALHARNRFVSQHIATPLPADTALSLAHQSHGMDPAASIKQHSAVGERWGRHPVSTSGIRAGRSETISSATTAVGVTRSPSPTNPRRGPIQPRRFVFTCLSAAEVSELEEAIRQIGEDAAVLECGFDAPPPLSVTHIVSRGAPKSVKAMCGLVGGRWLVAPEYILKSRDAGFWLDEMEEGGLHVFPPPLRYRRFILTEQNPLFREKLVQVIQFGEGEVVQHSADSDGDAVVLTSGDDLLQFAKKQLDRPSESVHH